MDQREMSFEELDGIAGKMPQSVPVGESRNPDCLAHGSYSAAHPEGTLTCVRCDVYVHVNLEEEPTCWSCGLDDQLSRRKIHGDMVQFRGVGVSDILAGENPDELPELEGF